MQIQNGSRALLTQLTALVTTLVALNTPIDGIVRTLIIFTLIYIFGALVLMPTMFSQGLSPIFQGPFSGTLLFLVGATATSLIWAIALAIGLAPYICVSLSALGCILIHASTGRKRTHSQFTDSLSHREDFFLSSAISVSVLSLLLFITSIPGMRSILIPLSLLNCATVFVRKGRNSSRAIGLILSVLLVKYMTIDRSVTAITDDLVFADSYSSIVQQTGFWSWFGASDVYSPYHWLAYGVSGWFTLATQNSFLFGSAVAFPAVLSVATASTISQIKIGQQRNYSFIVQVVAIVIGLQIKGAQSISADLGLLAILGLTVTLYNGPTPHVLPHLLLICVAFAKVQFVPVATIVLIVFYIANYNINLKVKNFVRLISHLGTLTLSTLIVLGIIPISKLFSWNANQGWGSVNFKFRGPDLLAFVVMRDIFGSTFLIFTPAILQMLIFLLIVEKPFRVTFVLPAVVTLALFLANLLFDITNSEYFGWIASAVCGLFLLPAMSAVAKDLAKVHLVWAIVPAIGLLMLFVVLESRADFDIARVIQSAQRVVAYLLALAVIASLTTRLNGSTYWKPIQVAGATSGVLLLIMPFVSYTAIAFHESGLRIEAKSGFTMDDLGFTRDLLQAGTWIRQHSDSSDVIGTNVLCEIGTTCPLDGRPLVAAATHRRTFIEAERFTYGYSPLHSGQQYPSWIVDRLTASVKCSSSGDVGACDILRSAGVKLLLVDTTRFNGSNGLPMCASFGSIQVFDIATGNQEDSFACSIDN